MDLDELERLADAATPGPWEITSTCTPAIGWWQQVVTCTSINKPNRSYPTNPGIVFRLQSDRTFEEYKTLSDADSAFIAAFNPAAVKELIREARFGRLILAVCEKACA